jgi:Family of unknown function (DUF6516)
MKAELLLRERHVIGEALFAEVVVWRLPRRLPGSEHRIKYRLALVARGVCVLRFDNESGKGDHKHIGRRQAPYDFVSVDRLLEDFWAAADQWSDKQ